ncbi:MAG TPA: hypothetical protein VEC12_07980 [Bacteroidia bacterium]|nr:hypothetical protein [Bacteroidia bacterium]
MDFISFGMIQLLNFLLLVVICSGCAISPKTKLSVLKIRSRNIVMSSRVGWHGIQPKQYRNFLSLKNHATQKELIKLTGHRNAAVRCYAFWALLYDSTAVYFQ